MSRIARLAVVGAGMMGAVHVDRIATSPSAELAVVSDLDEGSSTGGVPVVTDHRDLLSYGIDGVVIATPNHLHREMGLFFVEHGIPVLIEKPLAGEVAEGLELCRAADRAGVPILVGHHRRHHPVIQRARQVVESGIGRLVGTSTLLALRKPDSYYEPEWRRRADAGPLSINLIHELDLLRAVCGEIVAVQAVSRRIDRPWDFDDTAAVIVHYRDGAVGTVFVSDSTAAPWSWEGSIGGFGFHTAGEDYLSIMGTEASLSFPSLTGWAYDGSGESGWHTPMVARTPPAVEADAHALQIEHFARVVRGEEPPLVSGWDALRSLAILEAVIEAARTGTVVTVDTTGWG